MSAKSRATLLAYYTTRGLAGLDIQELTDFLDSFYVTSDATPILASLTGSASPFPVVGLAGTQGGAVTATGGASSTAGNAGGAVSLAGGLGGSTGAGGAVNLTGAVGGSASGTGGAVVIAGGAGTAGNAAGGAASVTGGLGQGSAAGGAASLISGAGGSTGVPGAVAITAGAATASAGASVTITASAGVGSTNGGGNVNLIPGAAASTGAPGEFRINSSSAGCVPVSVSYIATLVTTSFFVASRAYRVKSIIGCPRVAGTGGACSLTFYKAPSGTAIGSGTALHTGTYDMTATADTNQTLSLSAVVAEVTLAAGDRIGFVLTGTATSAVGCITVTVVPC